MNSRNCTLSGLSTNTSADRICGPCRFGYDGDGELCNDVYLQNIANENIAPGNVGFYLMEVATIVDERKQNQQGLADLVTVIEHTSQQVVLNHRSF